MIPLTENSDLQAVFWSEFFFTFMMTFVAVMAILDPEYKHPLTPVVIGLTVTQGVLGGWHVGAGTGLIISFFRNFIFSFL